jgi:hypothetical protein
MNKVNVFRHPKPIYFFFACLHTAETINGAEFHHLIGKG